MSNIFIVDQDNGQVSINTDGYVSKNLSCNHLAGNGTAPTITKGSPLGSTGTATLVSGSTDLAGIISLTAGGTGITSGTLATITFGTAFTNKPIIICAAANFAANDQMRINGHDGWYFDWGNASTSSFIIQASSALTSGYGIYVSYVVVGS